MAVDVRDHPAEMKPVMLGDVAFRDRDETGQSRFRGQQVVERSSSRPGPSASARRYPIEKIRRRRWYRKSNRIARGDCRRPPRERRELAREHGRRDLDRRDELAHRTGPECDSSNASRTALSLDAEAQNVSKLSAQVRKIVGGRRPTARVEPR